MKLQIPAVQMVESAYFPFSELLPRQSLGNFGKDSAFPSAAKAARLNAQVSNASSLSDTYSTEPTRTLARNLRNEVGLSRSRSPSKELVRFEL